MNCVEKYMWVDYYETRQIICRMVIMNLIESYVIWLLWIWILSNHVTIINFIESKVMWLYIEWLLWISSNHMSHDYYESRRSIMSYSWLLWISLNRMWFDYYGFHWVICRLTIMNMIRDVNRKPEIRFSVWKPKSGFRFWKMVFEIIF